MARRRPRRNPKRGMKRTNRRGLRKRYGKHSIYKPIGFMNGNLCHMRYVDRSTITAAAGTINFDQWRANSIFDPYVAGGGHTPMGKTDFFRKFTYGIVEKSFITVTFFDFTVATPIYCGVLATQGGALPVSSAGGWRTLMELGYPMKAIEQNGSSSDSKAVKVRSSMNASRFFGSIITNPTDFAVTAGADCARQSYYNVWIQSQDQTNNSGLCEVSIQIDYYVRGYNPVVQVENP